LNDDYNYNYNKFKSNELKIDAKFGNYIINEYKTKEEVNASKFYDIIVQIKINQ
jgi:hypothetical protein